MKLFEEFDTQYLGSERYSLYQHNKVDNYLIKNSLKFFLFNTSEKNLENCLLQYELLKSIDVSPIIFTPNLDYFIKNKIPEKNLIETDGFSYINCFNEIIRCSNSNYVFIINSNIILDNLNEIVNRFYIIYQNFSDKLAGWSINIKNTFKNKIYHEFKIDENVYFSPRLSLDFFCVKSEYLKKIGLLSYVRDNVRDNEDCQGLDYLLGWLVNVNKEYLINDFNIELILTEEKNEDSILNEEKLNKIIEKQYFFFEANKSIYHLNDDFLNFWKGNILQL
jgi:hypothetical protein